MDRLRGIADAHYRASPGRVKALAHDFFKALDTDQDGRVSLPEFLAFMTSQGYTRLNNPNFFRDLDRNGDGSLDFWEVLTLYYIVKSGRPLCDCCGMLIPGTFFSCVECFESPWGAYSLCIFCYRSNKSSHNHNGHQQFLDTYTLLETKKRMAVERKRRNHHSNQTPIPQPINHVHIVNMPPQPPNFPPLPPNAVAPTTKTETWKTALTAFEVALSVGSISATMCSIL